MLNQHRTPPKFAKLARKLAEFANFYADFSVIIKTVQGAKPKNKNNNQRPDAYGSRVFIDYKTATG